jgi:hypothetical protein
MTQHIRSVQSSRRRHANVLARACHPPALVGALLVWLIAAPAWAQATNSWLGGDGMWSDPDKWSLGVVPNGSAPIAIPSGTVRDDVSFTLRSTLANKGGLVTGSTILDIINGTLNNEGGFTNAGTLAINPTGSLKNFKGARMSNGGLIVNGGVLTNLGNFNGFLGTIANSETLSNSGTLNNFAVLNNNAGGTLTNNAGGVLTNALGGKLTIKSDSMFINAGTLTNNGL